MFKQPYYRSLMLRATKFLAPSDNVSTIYSKKNIKIEERKNFFTVSHAVFKLKLFFFCQSKFDEAVKSSYKGLVSS